VGRAAAARSKPLNFLGTGFVPWQLPACLCLVAAPVTFFENFSDTLSVVHALSCRVTIVCAPVNYWWASATALMSSPSISPSATTIALTLVMMSAALVSVDFDVLMPSQRF
jgi:hypothetical protein